MQKKDEASPIEFLLSELQHLPVSDAAKNEFLGLLRRMAGQRVQLKKALLLTPHRLRAAEKMINDGHRAPAVRDALMQRSGVGRTTSYKLLAIAINKRFEQIQEKFTQVQHNGNP